MPEKCIQHLLQEHRDAEKILAVLDEVLESLQKDPRWCNCQAAAFARVRAFLLEAWPLHECKEETIFFPVLENFFPRDVGPLEILRNELAQISQEAGHLIQSGSFLAPGDSQPNGLREFQCAARAYSQLLRDHIYKEDRILFPMVARRLTSGQDDDLIAQMTSCCPAVKIEAT